MELSPQNTAAPRIQVLPPAVAERIAAGEVIERPSSVVKELLENSLDAGATEVTVVLEAGGKALIEVIDNGLGMSPDDLSLCVQRHATSKLHSLDDLDHIRTLGFRGEALPSVAAVSELSVLSRPRAGSPDATAYELELSQDRYEGVLSSPQPVTFGHFLGSPHGTRIRARGLFSQVPARLKFLKSQGAEVAQVREWMERLALTHPQAGFRLVSDGRSVLSLRPQDEVARVRAILADGEDYPVVSRTSDHNGISVRAHWIQGLSAPQTKRLVQVVNKRAVRDRMLQQAILSAFRQALLPGQFPAVALFIDVEPGTIDVNVHPTKTEVRFLDSSKVFKAVSSLLDSMIASHGVAAHVATSSPTFSSTPAGPWRAAESLDRPASQAGWNFTRSPTAPYSEPASTFATPSAISSAAEDDLPIETSKSEPVVSDATPAIDPEIHPAAAPILAGRFTGIVFNTYLVHDLGDELALIDQHAAHERVRYEQLRKRVLARQGTAPQALLLPETVRFDPAERPELESRLPLLAALGFEAEVFGEDCVLFRGVPAEWGTEDLRTRLKNLVGKLMAAELNAGRESGREADRMSASLMIDESLFESLASEACHSAIRAGDRIGELEAASLVDRLFRCEHPWNCPHGRPTVVRIPRGKIEEWFQRRV